jgi:photosystem II stability/assembly factor-like uncharacterized protein
MPVIEDYFDDVQGMVWVQPDGPNTTVYALACHNLDTIDESLGSVSTRYCRTSTGGWRSVSRSQGSPGDVTGTIESWLPLTQSWLQLIAERRCPFAVYIHHTDCERDDIFLNYDHGELLQDTIITARSKGALVKTTAIGEEDSSPSTMSFDVTAVHPLNEYWTLVEFYRDITEDEELRDIAFCNEPRCIGACGAAEHVCTDGVIVADAATGVTAEVWFTTDGGATWTSSATDPFAADEDCNSVVCFQTGRGVMRHLVQRGTTDGANPGEIAYSDDTGATWTTVNVGSTNGEYGMHSGGLFALDHRHIWCCTDQANIFFSDDAGVSWTDQGAPGTQELYYVHFVDANYGFCVGDARTTLYTNDGGDHWTATAGTCGDGAADVLTSVATLDSLRCWVGNSSAAGPGELWYTTDAGVTWTQRTLPIAATSIGDVMFIDDYCGYVTGIYNDGASDYPVIYRTFNGGMDWEYYIGDTALDGAVVHQGMNAIWVCGYNNAIAIGELVGATGEIMEVVNATPS